MATDQVVLITGGSRGFDTLTEAEDLPDLRTRNHLLQTSIRFSIVENASLRCFYRFFNFTTHPAIISFCKIFSKSIEINEPLYIYSKLTERKPL